MRNGGPISPPINFECLVGIDVQAYTGGKLSPRQRILHVSGFSHVGISPQPDCLSMLPTDSLPGQWGLDWL